MNAVFKSPHLGGFRGADSGSKFLLPPFGGISRWGQRTINLSKSTASFLASTITSRPFVFGMPPAVGIELTNHCNLKCPECPSGSGKMKRQKGFMDPELYSKVIKELKAYLWNVNLYFQGEPMMHPQFFDFLKESAALPLTVSTNGHFLSALNAERLAVSGLKKFIISLDGLDQDTYSKYRMNGDIDKVQEGIRNLTGSRKKLLSKLIVEIQMLVNRYNESQISEMKKFARESDARLILKSMQIYEGSSYSDWMPADSRFQRYILKNGEYRIKSTLPERCARLWFNPVITWDGKVLPCCFDKDADHVMGDLGKESFRDIWHGEKFRQFRNDVLHWREKIPICGNCTSGLRGVKL